jgi:transposase
MQAVQTQGYEVGTVLYMAMELANRSWKLAFSNGERMRRRSMPARDRGRLLEEVRQAKQRLEVATEGRVVVCYEAGRDGHWIYHWLMSEGFEVLEIDSSSIELARGRKHVKTDRVDVVKLLDLLLRYAHGYRRAFSVVRVPPREAEAAQRLHREDEYLVRQRARVSNRIQGLLVAQGLTAPALKDDFVGWLQGVQLWNGEALSASLQDELERLYEQYVLLNTQLAELAAAYQVELSSASAVGGTRQRLEQLKSMGPKTSRVLAAEVFSWREFANGKQVGAMAGLTPTPSRSGEEEREQGISKAGNRRVRRVLIELAWLWLRWQPDSALSQWFRRRFAGGGKRMRRVGIVALARKLLIALWRYVEWGVVPEGAVLKAV